MIQDIKRFWANWDPVIPMLVFIISILLILLVTVGLLVLLSLETLDRESIITINKECEETYPTIKSIQGRVIHNETVWCLSISKEEFTETRLIEVDKK